MAVGRFSRFAGGLRIGADYFERRGAALSAGPAPLGLVDAASELAHPGLDVERIHPEVRRFLERTAELDLFVRSSWRPWFGPLWRLLLRPVFGAIQQLFLPLHEATVRTRLLALAGDRDGRAGARGVLREYVGTGRVMQVLAYAVHRAEDGGYMSAALPLPLGNLAGLLRMEGIGEDEEGRLAVALTSRAPSGGIWFATPVVALRLPLRETLSLWAAGTRCAPSDLDSSVVPGCVLVGRHEQRLLGALVVSHDYWFYPRKG